MAIGELAPPLARSTSGTSDHFGWRCERRSEGRERPFGLERLVSQENRPRPGIELAAKVRHVCTNRRRNSGARQDFARGPGILAGRRKRKDPLFAFLNRIHCYFPWLLRPARSPTN